MWCSQCGTSISRFISPRRCSMPERGRRCASAGTAMSDRNPGEATVGRTNQRLPMIVWPGRIGPLSSDPRGDNVEQAPPRRGLVIGLVVGGLALVLIVGGVVAAGAYFLVHR